MADRYARLLPAVAVLAALACRPLQPPAEDHVRIALAEGKLVDLSHGFDADTIYWPTEDGFVLKQRFAGYTAGGYYYAANTFCAPEHGGTHIDAPIHFAEGHPSVEKIPLTQLMAPAIVLDVSGSAASNRDYQVSVGDFERWEQDHGRIPDGTIVLLRTDFSHFWPNRERYMGTAERGPKAVAKLHFPGLSPEAAHWLTEERNIAAVGLDTPSIDCGQSTTFESHRTLFEHDVPAFENLTHLDELPPTGFSVIALPMKIRGGSGAPLRAVAVVPPQPRRKKK
jgi:kynurenine formamidase